MNTQILCIEDDQDIALAVSMVLRRAGFDDGKLPFGDPMLLPEDRALRGLFALFDPLLLKSIDE